MFLFHALSPKLCRFITKTVIFFLLHTLYIIVFFFLLPYTSKIKPFRIWIISLFRKKHLGKFIKDVAGNLSFDFMALFDCSEFDIITGFGAFGPKFIEVQFSLTAEQAARHFGITTYFILLH